MASKVVIVTGGGRGIGRAIGERFAGDAAQIVIASRSQDDLESACAAISDAGGTCHTEQTDVCEPDDINFLVENTIERFGRVDVLVNNAGLAPIVNIEDLNPSLFEAIQLVNCDAVYHGSRAVWPHMKKQGEGVIVNIASVAAVDPFPGFTAYGAAKAWVVGWTKGLALEGKKAGIRVFCVAPGATETRMLRGAFPDFPEKATLAPSDVADVVYALSQPACRYASGETVFVKK